MKLLTSRWSLAILALLIHAGVSSMVILGVMPKKEEVATAPPKTDLPPRIWSFKTKAVDDLIAELRRERDTLDTERKNVTTAQAQLAAEKAEIEKLRGEVQTMREDIDKRIVEIQADEMSNLKSLSTTYGTMPPSAAVNIIREMDESMAVKILALMKSDKQGPILGEMGKAADKIGEENMAKRAARISDKLRLMKPIKKASTLSSL
jgi:flagellar motility protein MotE (MotC chaperone)